MIEVAGVNGRFAWSQEAFARRCINVLDSRALVSPAGVITALNGMPFSAAGWTALKKIIAELIAGATAFPADLTADGITLLPGVTEFLIGTRDVSSTIT